MFEGFQHDARATVIRAKHEAILAGQHSIGSEHLLLGLLAEPGPGGDALRAAKVSTADLRAHIPQSAATEPDALDADALASLGIDLDAVRRATDARFGTGALDRAGEAGRGRRHGIGRPKMTAGAKRSLEQALHAAVRLKQRNISSGHLLLGIIEQPGGSAVAALIAAGVDIDDLRADVLQRLSIAA